MTKLNRSKLCTGAVFLAVLSGLSGCGSGDGNNSAIQQQQAAVGYISGTSPSGGACSGATLTVDALNTAGSVAASQSVAAGAQFQLTVPAAQYTVRANGPAGCSASQVVTAVAAQNQTITLVNGQNSTTPTGSPSPLPSYVPGTNPYPNNGWTYPYNYYPYNYYNGYYYGSGYYNGGAYYYPTNWCYGRACGGRF